MYITNIIELLAKSQEFRNALLQYEISERCVGLRSKLIPTENANIFAAELIFDFAPFGNSTNDMRVRVIYNINDNNIRIHSFDLPWPP